MIEKSAQADEGGGCTPTPFQPITYHAQKLQCTLLLRGQIDTLPLFHLFPICTLWFDPLNCFHTQCDKYIDVFFFRKKSLNVSWKQKAAEEADLVLSDDADSDVDQVSLVHSLITRVADPYPDPDWIRIQSGQWIRIRNLDPDSQSGSGFAIWIRIHEGKNDPLK
jgi:hypothetical protein